MFTNDRYPRAITADSELARADDWELSPITLAHGASIGAGYALESAAAANTDQLPDVVLLSRARPERLPLDGQGVGLRVRHHLQLVLHVAQEDVGGLQLAELDFR